jgi:hypothetical protein
MIAALIAGVGYYLSLFAFGIAFGTVREMLVEPELGELAGMLIELPFILGACWTASHLLVDRRPVVRTIPAALTMGLLAFVLLLATEIWLALWMPGLTIEDWFAQFRETAPAVGLIGQVLAAFFPSLQVLLRMGRGPRRIMIRF